MYTLMKVLVKASPLHDIGALFINLVQNTEHRNPILLHLSPIGIIFSLASCGSDATETLNRRTVSRVFKLICFCFCNKGNTKLI
jgi:hypothetical protein